MSAVPDVMTLREAASYLRIHWRTLADWARDGRVPVSRLGRAYRFRKVTLDQWLEDGGTDFEALVDEGLAAVTNERMAAGGRTIPLADVKARLGL
jgi:excisionase family DNA binding protein